MKRRRMSRIIASSSIVIKTATSTGLITLNSLDNSLDDSLLIEKISEISSNKSRPDLYSESSKSLI
jgi:hypothetical protein